jgi:hypothetical protein
MCFRSERMKISSIYLTVLIVLTSTFSGGCYASILDESIIDKVVKAITVELEGSEAGKSYIEGDLNQDGSMEVIILFTVEAVGGGGNNYSQYLLILYEIQSKDSFEVISLEVGGKTSRNLELSSVSDGVLVLNSYFIKPTDPFCCPSGEEVIYFSFTNNNLKEHKSSLAIDVERLLLLHRKIDGEAQRLLDNTTLFEQVTCAAESMLPLSLYFKHQSFEQEKPDWFTLNDIETLRLYWSISSLNQKFIMWEDISATLNGMSTPSWFPVSYCDSRGLHEFFYDGYW